MSTAETLKTYEASLAHFSRFQREVARLEDAISSFVDEEIIDRSYTAAMLGHHMFDWVSHARNEKTHDWRNAIVKTHVCLGVLHDVCTAVKHVNVSVPQSDVGATSVKTSVGFNSEQGVLKEMLNNPHVVHQVQGKEIFYKTVKVAQHNLLDALKEAEKFWINYFASLGLNVERKIQIPPTSVQAAPKKNPLISGIEDVIKSAPNDLFMAEDRLWLGQAKAHLSAWDQITTTMQWPSSFDLNSAIPSQRRIAANKIITLLHEALCALKLKE